MKNLSVKEKTTILSPENVWWLENTCACIFGIICIVGCVVFVHFVPSWPTWIPIVFFMLLILFGYLVITGKIFWGWNDFYFMKKIVNDKKIADAARKIDGE